ncbi:hypothetical protein EON79_23140 [bacterium]|nr:MAG: hypothetical protein EON79_23140 [bacterium]
MSIVRSIYAIFGLGPNNMFDALATPLGELFTSKPDATPYQSVGVDPRLFDPKKAIDPKDPRFLKARSTKSPVRDGRSRLHGVAPTGAALMPDSFHVEHQVKRHLNPDLKSAPTKFNTLVRT